VFDDTSWMRPLALLLLLLSPSLPHWDWPVSAPHPVVRPFLAPPTPYGVGHRGIDIGTSSAVIRAPADGVVHFAGVVVDRPVLSISHAGGLISSFEPVTSTLRKGDSVSRGDVIGSIEPGHCASPCLHFGVRQGGEYVSPLLLLGGVPRAVLLPTRSIA
jgi:murein DD-endopeptidase MepM/ murein hydrolase activator NlpD